MPENENEFSGVRNSDWKQTCQQHELIKTLNIIHACNNNNTVLDCAL